MTANVLKMKEFSKSFSKYNDFVTKIIGAFEINLIVYDEIENFQDYDSEMFNYPFDRRKNVIQTFQFDSNVSTDNYAYYH